MLMDNVMGRAPLEYGSMWFNKQPNQVERLTRRYMEKGDFARLGEALDRLKTEKLTRDEREMWWHSRGLVEFQSGNRDAALQFFEEGARRFPESVPLLFSLGQEYEAKGRIDEARTCWDSAC